ncbi:TRAP transporter small permease [Pseudosulfitobacter koreensis]|uniref:TRAP transporter small permease protein n=1 Tax=Pseudosulfitobacter koreensis TaxID=2968472 RepID=A0ABT1Z0K4_9RHOB|nr:TRAP transporter small permease [Pseudosulfitobacter koreense]MCR8826670.1 TRAP transporter small permease [Pseudosulfitobacter koreense]
MIVIVGLVTTSVIMRRVAGSPLHITEDVVGLLLSAMLFLGLPLVTLRAQHVRVSIVSNALEPRFGGAVHVAAVLVGMTFFGWIFIKAMPWLEFAWQRNLKTETARLLLYPWMTALPLSVGLTWVIFAARLTGLLERERNVSLEALPKVSTAETDIVKTDS